MTRSIQVTTREGASVGELATAAAKALLMFLTSTRVNAALGACATVCLLSCIASGQHTTATAAAVTAWVTHFALMSALDIRKGGVKA